MKRDLIDYFFLWLAVVCGSLVIGSMIAAFIIAASNYKGV